MLGKLNAIPCYLGSTGSISYARYRRNKRKSSICPITSTCGDTGIQEIRYRANPWCKTSNVKCHLNAIKHFLYRQFNLGIRLKFLLGVRLLFLDILISAGALPI